ncbi:MAG: hypothetical protein QXJ74_00860 [Nitrososphaera sp.]|uniref:hypothetical protein n=1 Tax=Nitrososphaera sp. TaxID=1971748 RepID=UPI0018084171|nr:hypothetical protein [Nitrososphaera sp.]NWG37470.1 hypothetical protein [Nitrososphaera sp.]
MQAAKSHDLRVLGIMIGAALFFAVTLLISFFGVIIMIKELGIPASEGPNYFMLGLVPPSIGTFFLFTKVLGRFL